MREASYADLVIEEALRSASSGLNVAVGERAMDKAMKAMEKQAAALEKAEYEQHEHATRCPKCDKKIVVLVPKPSADVVARAMSHTAKVVDGTVRLMAFAKGLPDSRPELGGDWLRALSDEQVRQVQRWVEESQAT